MSNLYGRIMPASKKQLNDKIDLLKKHTDKIEEQICKIKKQNIDEIHKTQVQIAKDQKETELNMSKKISVLQQKLESMERSVDGIVKKLQYMDQKGTKSLRASNEAVWANVFHDAVRGSEWLKNQTFYPGRWAAGYPFLYALYRSLNDARPRSILELGLGQTTRMIGQYVTWQKDCKHIVTEHDKDWISYFKQDFELSERTEILELDIEKKSYYGTEPATAYIDFAEKLKGKKFDMISIDAPFGGNTLEYARMDILGLLPECLEENFVIFLDDYNRKGEQNMHRKLEEILDENNISYKTGKYEGNKDTLIIASMNWKFLCSM